MFVEIKSITVTAGNADKMIEKFSKGTVIQTQEGFIEKSVLKSVKKGDNEEVMVIIKWKDQQSYTNWKTSDAHKSGHKNKGAKADFIVDSSMALYTVEDTVTI